MWIFHEIGLMPILAAAAILVVRVVMIVLRPRKPRAISTDDGETWSDY